MVLSYEEYVGMGGAADAASFDRLEEKAQRIIDRATHNRVASEVPARGSVKRCACELIENLWAEEHMRETGGGREIASMSNDGVSLHFSDATDDGFRAHRTQILRIWLDGELSADGVNLLYTGVDS